MSFHDYLGVPEFHEDEVVVKVADEAFICTRCGIEKEDKSSTFCFFKGEVLCDGCLSDTRA